MTSKPIKVWPDLNTIDDKLSSLIGERADDGSYLICRACEKFDHNKYRGKVKCNRGRIFSYSTFVSEHANNKYHITAVQLMVNDMKVEQNYLKLHGKPRPTPKKRKQQIMTFFALPKLAKKITNNVRNSDLISAVSGTISIEEAHALTVDGETTTSKETPVVKAMHPSIPVVQAKPPHTFGPNLAHNLDKTICNGALGLIDHGNIVTQRGIKSKKELYCGTQFCVWEIKPIPGSRLLSVFSDQCIGESVKLRDVDSPTKKSYKCIACHKLCHNNRTWKRDFTKNMVNKGRLYTCIDMILDGKADLKSESSISAIDTVNNTSPTFLTIEGGILRIKVRALKVWLESREVGSSKKSENFLSKVRAHIQNNPEWEDAIEIDMLRHSINKANGKKGRALHLNENTRMMFIVMAQKSETACNFLS